ncbi:MAG: hypothetical protein JW996_02125, partial [Candidatus Cloacimonetes bacterium]|nr:hypothetical protein [Candidatus Cloacimonadota bacterium]
IMPRFPYFQVFLQRGFFWYYLQKHQEIPVITLMKPLGINKFPNKKMTSHLLKISVKGRVIAVDFSHILTDGNGGLRFLMSFIAEYLRSLGIKIEHHQNLLEPGEIPDPEEFQDSHRHFFKAGIPGPPNLPGAFHIEDKQLYKQGFRLITGKISSSELLELTRANKASITEYLVALYLHCLAEIYQDYLKQGRKPDNSVIRLEVPVDMRKFYPSSTMRNFSLYISPEIDGKLGEYNFKEILNKVHHSMQIQSDHKELARQISRNVAAELNPLIRIVPLFLKDLYLSGLYSRLGEKIYSGVLSNLGRINIPESMASEIDSVNVIMYPNQLMKKSCSVLSFGDDLYINLSSAVKSRDFEHRFFTHLVKEGISVMVKEE